MPVFVTVRLRIEVAPTATLPKTKRVGRNSCCCCRSAATAAAPPVTNSTAPGSKLPDPGRGFPKKSVAGWVCEEGTESMPAVSA